MQTLLSVASTLPSVLQKVDELQKLPSDEATSAAYELWTTLFEILGRLEQWKQSFRQGTSGLLYWTRLTQCPNASQFQPLQSYNHNICIWFPNISVANSLIHFWAFRAICLMQIRNLATSFPTLGSGKLSAENQVSESIYRRDLMELATRICQSMDYLMQDEMKLYGPASTLFPLRTALGVFKEDSQRSKEYVAWCLRIVNQLLLKGIYSASLIIEENP